MTLARRRGARLGVAVGVVSLGLGVGASVLLVQSVVRGWFDITDGTSIETLVASLVLSYAFSVVGLVLVRRLPGNALGWTYLTIGVFESLNLFAGAYSTWAYFAPGLLPAADLLSWVGVWAWVPAFTLFSTFAILLFPTGGLPSRRWWPVVVLSAIAFVLLLVPVAVASWPYRGEALEAASALNTQPPSGPATDAASALQNVGQVVLLAAMIGSVAAVIARFRQADLIERQQLKWFAFGAVVAVAILLVYFVIALPPILAVGSAIVFGLALPAAIAIAILRYRLYDIDRLISRTIAWGLLTATVGAVYLAAVLVLQDALGGLTQGDVLAVAGSTLLAAAAFQPLRRRIQAVVDRRFDRGRYDAQVMADAFAERLRGEVAIDVVARDLASTIDGAIRPTRQGLWLREAPR